MIHAIKITREHFDPVDLGLPPRKGRVYWWKRGGPIHLVKPGEEVPDDVAAALKADTCYKFRTGEDGAHKYKDIPWSYYFRVTDDDAAMFAWEWAMADVGDYANEYKTKGGEWKALFG